MSLFGGRISSRVGRRTCHFLCTMPLKNMGARAWPGMNADKEIEILF